MFPFQLVMMRVHDQVLLVAVNHICFLVVYLFMFHFSSQNWNTFLRYMLTRWKKYVHKSDLNGRHIVIILISSIRRTVQENNHRVKQVTRKKVNTDVCNAMEELSTA